MDATSGRYSYEFGGYFLDGIERRLTRANGDIVELKSRAFDTLLYLVEHRDELIEKRRLMQAVWPRVIVSENNLNQAIAAARRALGDKPGEHRFIVTIPGRGYRFVAEVRTVAAAAVIEPAASTEGNDSPTESVLMTNGSSDDGAAPTTSRIANPVAAAESLGGSRQSLRSSASVVLVLGMMIAMLIYLSSQRAPGASMPAWAGIAEAPSLAVMPFLDLSPDQDQGYFADGLAEELLSILGRMPGLRVIGRTSSFAFKDSNADMGTIQRTLGVTHVLQGSVRMDGEKVRVTATLVDARDASQLWSDNYDREFRDVFAIESDIALHVANALMTRLSLSEQVTTVRQRTSSPDAYALYLEAREYWRQQTASDLLLSLERIDRALLLDPKFVPGWVMKATLHDAASVFFPRQLQQEQTAGERAALHAIELDPDYAPAHARLATLLANRGDWLGAEQESHRARALGLGDDGIDSTYRFALGYIREARERTVLRLNRDPLNSTTRMFLVSQLDALGETTAALDLYQRGDALFSEWPAGHAAGLMTLLGSGAHEQAGRLLANEVINPVFTEIAPHFNMPDAVLARLHEIYRDEAYRDFINRMSIAWLAAYFGDQALASTALIESLREFAPNAYMLWRPMFRELRVSGAFDSYFREAGFVDYWRQYGWPDRCAPEDGEGFRCS